MSLPNRESEGILIKEDYINSQKSVLKSCTVTEVKNMHKVKLTQIWSPLSSTCRHRGIETSRAAGLNWSDLFSVPFSQITGCLKPGLSKDTDSP